MDQQLLESAIRNTLSMNRAHRRLIEEKVRDIGFHRTAHMMLMHLAKNEKSPSQRELADMLSITPAAVTGILKNLERDGYIKRSVGKDTRFNKIYITDLGRGIVEQSKEAFMSLDCAMFEGFSDSELEAYSRMLERMKENLKRKREEKHEQMV